MSFKSILHEVVDHNPNASPKEITDMVINYIGLSLPLIIKTVRTPRTPSPFEMVEREFLTQRLHKGGKESADRQASEQHELGREIASLRLALDGSSSPSFIAPGFQIDGNSHIGLVSIAPENTGPEVALFDFPKPEPTSILDELEDLPAPMRSRSPYSGYPQESSVVYGSIFVLDHEAENKLSTDEYFPRFMFAVEVAVRTFAHDYKLNWSFEVSLPTDIEMPEWKKIVLRIKPTSTGLDFNDKLQLWGRIDKGARTKIESIKENATAEVVRSITDMNRNFFIEMDFDV